MGSAGGRRAFSELGVDVDLVAALRRRPRRPAAIVRGMCVFDRRDVLVGVAPWYVCPSRVWGGVLRFLGTDEVCSDYLSVLCQPGFEDDVAAALADWLLGAAGERGSQTPAAAASGGGCSSFSTSTPATGSSRGWPTASAKAEARSTAARGPPAGASHCRRRSTSTWPASPRTAASDSAARGARCSTRAAPSCTRRGTRPNSPRPSIR